MCMVLKVQIPDNRVISYHVMEGTGKYRRKLVKRILAGVLVILGASFIAYGDDASKRNIVIRKGFRGSNTYLIVCKGFPKEGAEGLQRRETAREAALLNAQMIARDIFNDTVDPVRCGLAKKFVVYDEYVVVYYELTKKNLKKRQRTTGKGK